MQSQTLNYINGKFLYYAFVAGGRQIMENQMELNRINVFPVRDMDTGTNLASTIQWIIDNIKPHNSYKTTVCNIAQAALIGARGNSGVIFAQFLYGLSCETENKSTITLSEFADSVKRSIPYVYGAISSPVEGTMLTIIKDWSSFLSSKKESIKDFKKLLIESFEVLEISLRETTTKLKELNKHGFVDAGAKGFVLFIKGIIDFLNNRNIRNLTTETNNEISLVHKEDITHEKIEYRYCTEAIIKNIKIENTELRKLLNKNGDSVVIAGSGNICRIHVHTNYPALLFDKLRETGTITYQKVDDMVRQQEITNNRKWNIAIVTDSTCDLSQELLDMYQINVLPINLYFGENHYLDKVTIQPDQFYNLLDINTVFPVSSQINEISFINLYSNLASHYDAIISIHLSNKFSGTCANSRKAAEKIKRDFKKDVYVIDSRNLSGALGLLVLKAAKNIEAGKSAEDIVQDLKTATANTKIYVSVKNLKYMIKGGRVSKPKGVIASILGINPIVSMNEEGGSLLFGKTLGQKSGLNKIYRHIEQIIKDKEVWNYIILHAHNANEAKKAGEKMLDITGKRPVSVIDISPIIGMHAGKGAVAISLMLNK